MRPRDEIEREYAIERLGGVRLITVEILLDIRDLLTSIAINTEWGPGPIQNEAGKLQARREELEALVTEREMELAVERGAEGRHMRVLTKNAAKMRALGEG